MPIKEEQLVRWAQAPSPTEMEKIKNARKIIEDSLKRNLTVGDIKKENNLHSFNYEVYLQGSYANSTNIRFDSDVDIVVQLNGVFWNDQSQLTEVEKDLFKQKYPSVKYAFVQFKNSVFNALKESFGDDVEYSGKCIKIKENSNRVNADVVPCFQYRVYKRFISYHNEEFIEGIKFFDTTEQSEIINFPKKHIENCESKNVDTDSKFKSIVRIFKNIKSDLVENKTITDKQAPSYFIENLLYNCSSPCFDGKNFSECMILTFQFLYDALQTGRLAGFVCANEQDSLIDDKVWNLIDAQSFILSAANYYLKQD